MSAEFDVLLCLQDQAVMAPGGQAGPGTAPAAGALCLTGSTVQGDHAQHHQQQTETGSPTGNALWIGIGIGSERGLQTGAQTRQEKQQQVAAADLLSLAA
jgi:hypothetical protein